MWRCTVWLKFTDVSEERTVSELKIKPRKYEAKACTIASRDFAYFWFIARLAYSAILKIEAVRSSKTPVNLYRTTRRHIPENSTLPIIKPFFKFTKPMFLIPLFHFNGSRANHKVPYMNSKLPAKVGFGVSASSTVQSRSGPKWLSSVWAIETAFCWPSIIQSRFWRHGSNNA
jgi:hypothetical protein